MHNRIKELRNKLNLSLTQMGDSLNVSASAISLLENGKRNVTDRTLADLERIYNVNPIWLKTGEGSMFKERTRQVEIAEIAAQMFNADKDDIRYQIMVLVSQMTSEEIQTVANLVLKLSESIKKNEADNED